MNILRYGENEYFWNSLRYYTLYYKRIQSKFLIPYKTILLQLTLLCVTMLSSKIASFSSLFKATVSQNQPLFKNVTNFLETFPNIVPSNINNLLRNIRKPVVT